MKYIRTLVMAILNFVGMIVLILFAKYVDSFWALVFAMNYVSFIFHLIAFFWVNTMDRNENE